METYLINLSLHIAPLFCVFLAAFLQSITGFGLVIVAAPLLMFFYDPKLVIPIMILLATCGNIAQTILLHRECQWKVIGWLLLGAVIGQPLGYQIYAAIPAHYLKILISCVVLVSLGGVRALHFSPVGDALALGAAVSWGVYSAAVTAVNRGGWHPVAAIRRAFFWALVFMLPLLLFALAAPETAAQVSCSVNLLPEANAARFARPANLANLAFLGLLASACCFVAWNKACERLGTVRCSLGLYLIPVLAFLIAHVFLGETLPAAGVVGAVLVLAGVAVAGSVPRD